MYKYPMKDKDSITIKLTNGTDVNSVPIITSELTCNCTIQDKITTRFDEDGHQVTLTGLIFKKGDIFKGVDKVEGIVIKGANELKIFTFSRIRDPLGHVHHIEIEVF